MQEKPARSGARTTQRRSAFTPEPTLPARPELSRGIVVARALEILDSEGEAALTFRRLAADLGAGTTSVRWYAPSREMLLDLCLDAVAGEVWAAIPERQRAARTSTRWRADLRHAAEAMYGGLGSRPWAGRQQLVSADRGPNQLRVWNHLGQVCFRAGLSEEQTFYAMTAVLSFVLGYVAQESAPTHPGVDRRTHLTALAGFMRALDETEFGALHRISDVFVEHTQQAQFDAGLDLLLDGLEKQANA